MNILVKEIKTSFSALVSLTEASLRATVEMTRLGWIWWVINPLVMMGVYYFLVSVILNRGGDDYHLFILTGLVAWQYFNNSFLATAKVIPLNGQLLKQVALPISMLVSVPILVQTLFAVIGCIVIMIWNYSVLGLHSFLVIPLLLLTGLTSYAFGLFIAVCNVYIGDVEQLLQYVMRMGFFLSPVLFPVETVLQNDSLPELFKLLFQLNPMAVLISAFRSVLLYGRMFEIQPLFILLAGILILTQIGLFLVRKSTPQIAKMV